MRLMLNALRRNAGLSQQELADKLGIPRRTYGSYEREERPLNLRQAAAICEVLGCTPNDLCDWYATHPRENTPALSHEHKALLADYDACTPQQRGVLLMTAQNAALASGGAAGRAADGAAAVGA